MMTRDIDDYRSLDRRLGTALQLGERHLERLQNAEPADRRDELQVLLRIHDLHILPLEHLGGQERWQHHPVVAELKWRLEKRYLDRLRSDDAVRHWVLPTGSVAAVRAIAASDRVPPIYQWLATRATREQMVQFIALEGGPDGGFDDLVAVCQVGLAGEAKVELARNYWDEMGRGDPQAVHTELHHRLRNALRLQAVSRDDQPLAALERAALGSLLATNRALQPEMLGALGLIELQAGPRCRQVVTALHRLGAPAETLPFYEEHASVDPVHGKRWLDNVVATLGTDPTVGRRMVQGARWRSIVNARFLAAVGHHLRVTDRPGPRATGDWAGHESDHCAESRHRPSALAG